MVGWHHQLDEHEFDQCPTVSDGQGLLACCSPWGRKELDTTEWLNWLIYSSQPDFTCYLSYYLMIKVKEESEKADLKLNIQKTNIIVSGPIIIWQTDREKMEIVTTFIFLHSKITADNDFSHEIKICLLIGRKAMINLDSVLKSRAITLPTNVHIVKVILFLVVLYGCENWTIKKAECRIIDVFTLWCWRRPLRVLWRARRSNQSNLKEISSCICIGRIDAQALIICAPDGKCQLTLKDPDVGNDWSQEKKGWQRMRWLEGIINSMDMSLSKLWEMVKNRDAWHAAVHAGSNSQTWLSEWTIPQPSWTICSLSSWVYTSERKLGIDMWYGNNP